MTQARRARLRLGFHPLSPSRWPDLVALFGVNGACGGCWCMWPRRSSAEFRRGKGAGNRRALRQLVGLRRPIGLLAYVDDRAVGWCAVAPRSDFQRLERSRVLQPVDEQPVWSVVCLFVARPERGQGVTVELLEQAFRYATRKGARIVEGYPLDVSGRTADTFAWWGTASAFRKAGFEEVARRSPTRPIMRRWLRRTAPRATPPPDRRGRG
ncbi:MAG TPA: GNAT family N-acetyltransferase [Candidatus Limnocylindria bacterium]|nr:GNAT family N-acetyltransferase [Candidatus Limnocylindria bacterium]